MKRQPAKPLREDVLLDAGQDLLLRQSVVQARLPESQRGDWQHVGPLVALASVPAPSARAANDHGHMRQIFCKLVLEEQFSQACQSKLAVRPQGPHEPLETVPEKHVVIGAFPDQRLVEVQPLGGWAQASLPVVEAPELRRAQRAALWLQPRWCVGARPRRWPRGSALAGVRVMPCSCVGLPQATGKKKGGPSGGGWSDELRAAFRGVVVVAFR